MINHNESTFKGTGEIDLYYQSWKPTGKIKAVLAIVHGLGGHSSKYDNIVQHFIPTQYAIYGFDLRGHGRSPGQRGYINSWKEFREDLRIFLELIQTQHPGYPVFLLGHSLGSIIVLDYVLRYPQAAALQGIIILAPSLGKVGVSKIKLLVGKLLSRVWPRFSLNTGLDLAAGTRDEKVLASYTQDALRHTLGTARLATEFFDTVAWINNHTAEWRSPLLILHGGADRVALPEGGKIFYEQLTSCADKTRIEYPEAYHELQDDLNYQEVLADLESWMEKHLPSETL